MAYSESSSSSSGPGASGGGLLLTATIAVVGSAMLLWRVREVKQEQRSQIAMIQNEPDSSSTDHSSEMLGPKESHGSTSSRSKERRKRAKDPFKDLLKNNKKLDKALASTNSVPTSPLPVIAVQDIVYVDTGIQADKLPSPSTTPIAVATTSDDETLALRAMLSDRAAEVETLTNDLESTRSSLSATQNELRLTKDELDRARWESSAWRKKCEEMQTQLQSLTYQMQLQAQSFASLYPLQFQPPPHFQHSGGSGTASPATGSPASALSPLPSVPASQPQSPTAAVPVYHPLMYYPSPMMSPIAPTFGVHQPHPNGYTTPPPQQHPNSSTPPIMSPPLLPIPMPHPRQPQYPLYHPQVQTPPQSESRSRGRKREKRPRTAPGPPNDGSASEAQEQQLHAFQPLLSTFPSVSSSLSSTSSTNHTYSDSNPPSSSSSSSSFGDDPVSPQAGGEELNALLADAILKRPASFTGSGILIERNEPKVESQIVDDMDLAMTEGVVEEVTWPSIYQASSEATRSADEIVTPRRLDSDP